jgi:Mrp family chromosome partitioning ATPase
VIGSGPVAPNPAQLITSPRVEKLLTGLQASFDYVLIISPPVGQVADAYALAPFIDATLYVVRYNFTSKDQLEVINDIYLNKKLNSPMIVLNNAKTENGYSGRYGYEGKS